MARAEREPQCHFAGTVSGARGEQAAQVGARRQQNQPCQQHQSRNECLYPGGKLIAQKVWAR